MALGQLAISLGGATAGESIATELALGPTSQISLNDTTVRTLANKSGNGTTIDMLSFRGASSSFKPSALNTNIQNLNIYDYLVNAGWNKSSAVEFTIGTSVYVWSDSTSLPALTTGGAFPGGLKIINQGFIMGKGGTGADGTTNSSYTAATVGGPAINLTVDITIDNSNGYIGGGGGGGGALRFYFDNNQNMFAPGGGGAGGGAGGKSAYSSTLTAGGAGGQIGLAGADGTRNSNLYIGGGGGGGGRIMPGSGGAGANANASDPNIGYFFQGYGGGAGGGGGVANWKMTGKGGAGGSGGAVGGVGAVITSGGNVYFRAGGGGGGWGASGGTGMRAGSSSGETVIPAAGGGKAVNTNNYSITWTGGFPAARVFGGVS